MSAALRDVVVAAVVVLVGAMIEVPSILMELDALMERVDFVSVGSNDLLQFLFAADRSNPLVASRYDPLNVAALRALRRVVKAADTHEVPVTLCGEMAADPLGAMALIGLGFRSISMAPAAIGPALAGGPDTMVMAPPGSVDPTRSNVSGPFPVFFTTKVYSSVSPGLMTPSPLSVYTPSFCRSRLASGVRLMSAGSSSLTGTAAPGRRARGRPGARPSSTSATSRA